MKFDYFDNAATSRVDQTVSEIVCNYNETNFFNPSANYRPSVDVHNLIEKSRQSLLKLLKGYAGNLYFLSSGTEGDNTAFFGSKKRKNSNFVVSAAEHPAVFNAANALKSMGFEMRVCPVDGFGRVKEEEFSTLIDRNTSFVSIMHVNNETGGINDIERLVKTAKAINPNLIFHSDGVQAFGKIALNLTQLGVDLYTVSGHKIGAPKGIAALYAAKGINLSPLLYGGGQESGVRSSTENVSGIMAFAFAAERTVSELTERSEAYRAFATLLREKLSEIEEIRYLSDEHCSPHIFTLAFRTVRGEVLQHALEEDGFLVGTGSACSARRSHERIPQALGLKEYADGVLRISFGRENTASQVEALAESILKNYEVLKKYVGR